jgi:hypothetical protein
MGVQAGFFKTITAAQSPRLRVAPVINTSPSHQWIKSEEFKRLTTSSYSPYLLLHLIQFTSFALLCHRLDMLLMFLMHFGSVDHCANWASLMAHKHQAKSARVEVTYIAMETHEITSCWAVATTRHAVLGFRASGAV